MSVLRECLHDTGVASIPARKKHVAHWLYELNGAVHWVYIDTGLNFRIVLSSHTVKTD